MFEYKFITIKLSSFKGKPKEDYHKLIDDHGKNGWRLVQIFAPSAAGFGYPKAYELVFEKRLPM